MQFCNQYNQLDQRLYHRQAPNPLPNPVIGHFNHQVAEHIGWSQDVNLMTNWVDIIAGQHIPDGFAPLAMAYAGHQFGHWAGQLGDGRGLLMAQVIDNHGKLTDLHLKGVGRTPYSRMGDGRAVLRSTIREYLGGHALTHLGIASSNALGFVSSDLPVYREQVETAAALMRVADCHIRLGHLEWVASYAPDLFDGFIDHVMQTYFSDCQDAPLPILAMTEQIIRKTAQLMAYWQAYGFIHGVMNTDNLSLTGATIDFGPYAFMERLDPHWISNHSDSFGRYTHANQPSMALWNLQTTLPHLLRYRVGSVQSLSRAKLDMALGQFEKEFITKYRHLMCQRLGLGLGLGLNHRLEQDLTNATSHDDCHDNGHKNNHDELARDFVMLIHQNQLDYNNSFRGLLGLFDGASGVHQFLSQQFEKQLSATAKITWQAWRQRYLTAITDETKTINQLSNTNPLYIVRNGMLERAITQAKAQDFSEVDRLYHLLAKPFDEHGFACDTDLLVLPKGQRPVALSCSS